jgi:transcriptional regulator SbtR-like protein
MTTLARAADATEDPWTAFETLLYGYLESAQADAAFRFALLGPQEPRWTDIAAEKTDFSAITERIVQRAVDAGRLREDFHGEDFVVLTRGAMANMTGTGDWRRHVTLVLEGIRRRER